MSPLHAVRAELGDVPVKDDEGTLTTYGHDESDTADYLPQLVAFARDTADVQRVLRACMKHGVPVTPVAARSGKSGGSLPLEGGVSLSLERMNRILEVNPEDLTATVEPGVILEAFQKAVEEKGLFYPPDPNSQAMCTLGGNIAENAGGPRALKYGVTRDYVLGLEWVMPSGEKLDVGRRTIKGVAGYDLTGLLVGSEGTLGIATRITLQLIPRPLRVMTALVIFKDVLQAARAVSAVLAAGVLPRTLELLDDVSIRAIDGRGFNFPRGAGAAVIAEVDGNVEEGLFQELTRMGEVFEQGGALETLMAQDDSQREKLWAARRVVSSSLRAMKKHKISEDICVPRSKIPEAIERFKALGARHGLTVATYGHAGDGNLHANILYEGPHERPKVDLALEEMMRVTVSLGGTITGEHGVGLAKRNFLSFEQRPELISLQRSIKTLFDPKGLLNPGKIFPPEKIS
ncbi:MAG: FAD-binding protein [Archangiaceae bacterium]|nr:FAD-binding protein [Archangiaceae bacterium]